MTQDRTAGDHAPHATSARLDAGAGLRIRAALDADGTLAAGAGLLTGPATAGQDGKQEPGGPAPASSPARQAPPAAAAARKGRAARPPRTAGARRKAGRQRTQPAGPGPAAGRRPGRHLSPVADIASGVPPEIPGREVRVGSPSALLALVPHLLGFEPRDSIVVIGTQQPRGLMKLTLRYDLPQMPDPGRAAAIAGHAIGILRAQGIETAVAVGYGPGERVTPVADALRGRAARTPLRLTEVLRVAEGRYWSYVCTEPSCCPAEGTPFDAVSHPVAAAIEAAGAPPVLAGREALAATVAALGGEAADAMRRATLRAEDRAARLAAGLVRSRRPGAARRLIAAVGLEAVGEAIVRYRAGGEFSSDADAAWVSVVLRDLRVRDDAWARMDPEYRTAHLRLWTDLTRRAMPGYVAAPAALLAFVAWQSGNGALANVALDRALADDPRYSMAMLLRQALDSGAPPSLARLPMTPEEVAQSYAGLGDDEADPQDGLPADDDLAGDDGRGDSGHAGEADPHG